MDSTIRCLQRHGLVINWNKSLLCASQQILHLGVLIDIARDKVFVFQERQEKLQNTLRQATADHQSNMMFLTGLLGTMVSCQDVIQWARFHARPLQWFLLPFQKAIALKRTCLLWLPKALIQELRWWLSPQIFSIGFSLRDPHKILVLTESRDQPTWMWGPFSGEDG